MATLNAIRSNEPASGTSAVKVDMKFEIVVIPVSDVDRAKEFYGRLGWRLDADFDSGKDYRVIQFTPPGSGCSIIFGKNVTEAAPGSAQGLYLIVSDIEAARKELLGLGVEISEAFHDASGVYDGPDEPYLFGRRRVSGPDPTVNTRRGSDRPTTTGRTGTPSTWCASKTVKSCRGEALRRNRHRDGPGRPVLGGAVCGRGHGSRHH